uniref:EF-hand domain-containing protein n=1 Tax=Kalanchoe fedtschenkoi TaxID=63787 RepID=A0A7N0UY86_KALFE
MPVEHNQNQSHPPASYGHPQPYSPPPGAASICGQYQAPQSWSGTVTPPEVMRLFHVADRDRSGFLDEQLDRNRNGKMDGCDLSEALASLGYPISPSVLHILVSKYSSGGSLRIGLTFDNFHNIQCGMIVKGLTDKFKEKDSAYTGSATWSYDAFLTAVLPYLAPSV